MAVPVNQARKDDVGDVFVPAVNEEVGLKIPCGSEIPATTVSLRSLAAAGIWLASVAGVMPSCKISSALVTEENASVPPINAIAIACENRVCLVLIRAVIWTKVLPHQIIALKFTIHDER